MDIEQEGDSLSATRDSSQAASYQDDSNPDTVSKDLFGCPGSETEPTDKSEISVASGASSVKSKKKKRVRHRRKNKKSPRSGSVCSENDTLSRGVSSERIPPPNLPDKSVVVTTYVCSSTELDKVRKILDIDSNGTAEQELGQQDEAGGLGSVPEDSAKGYDSAAEMPEIEVAFTAELEDASSAVEDFDDGRLPGDRISPSGIHPTTTDLLDEPPSNLEDDNSVSENTFCRLASNSDAALSRLDNLTENQSPRLADTEPLNSSSSKSISSKKSVRLSASGSKASLHSSTSNQQPSPRVEGSSKEAMGSPKSVSSRKSATRLSASESKSKASVHSASSQHLSHCADNSPRISPVNSSCSSVRSNHSAKSKSKMSEGQKSGEVKPKEASDSGLRLQSHKDKCSHASLSSSHRKSQDDSGLLKSVDDDSTDLDVCPLEVDEDECALSLAEEPLKCSVVEEDEAENHSESSANVGVNQLSSSSVHLSKSGSKETLLQTRASPTFKLSSETSQSNQTGVGAVSEDFQDSPDTSRASSRRSAASSSEKTGETIKDSHEETPSSTRGGDISQTEALQSDLMNSVSNNNNSSAAAPGLIVEPQVEVLFAAELDVAAEVLEQETTLEFAHEPEVISGEEETHHLSFTSPKVQGWNYSNTSVMSSNLPKVPNPSLANTAGAAGEESRQINLDDLSRSLRGLSLAEDGDDKEEAQEEADSDEDSGVLNSRDDNTDFESCKSEVDMGLPRDVSDLNLNNFQEENNAQPLTSSQVLGEPKSGDPPQVGGLAEKSNSSVSVHSSVASNLLLENENRSAAENIAADDLESHDQPLSTHSSPRRGGVLSGSNSNVSLHSDVKSNPSQSGRVETLDNVEEPTVNSGRSVNSSRSSASFKGNENSEGSQRSNLAAAQTNHSKCGDSEPRSELIDSTHEDLCLDECSEVEQVRPLLKADDDPTLEAETDAPVTDTELEELPYDSESKSAVDLAPESHDRQILGDLDFNGNSSPRSELPEEKSTADQSFVMDSHSTADAPASLSLNSCQKAASSSNSNTSVHSSAYHSLSEASPRVELKDVESNDQEEYEEREVSDEPKCCQGNTLTLSTSFGDRHENPDSSYLNEVVDFSLESRFNSACLVSSLAAVDPKDSKSSPSPMIPANNSFDESTGLGTSSTSITEFRDFPEETATDVGADEDSEHSQTDASNVAEDDLLDPLEAEAPETYDENPKDVLTSLGECVEEKPCVSLQEIPLLSALPARSSQDLVGDSGSGHSSKTTLDSSAASNATQILGRNVEGLRVPNSPLNLSPTNSSRSVRSNGSSKLSTENVNVYGTAYGGSGNYGVENYQDSEPDTCLLNSPYEDTDLDCCPPEADMEPTLSTAELASASSPAAEGKTADPTDMPAAGQTSSSSKLSVDEDAPPALQTVPMRLTLSSNKATTANLSASNSDDSLDSAKGLHLPQVPNPSIANPVGLENIKVPELNLSNLRRWVGDMCSTKEMQDASCAGKQNLELETLLIKRPVDRKQAQKALASEHATEESTLEFPEIPDEEVDLEDIELIDDVSAQLLNEDEKDSSTRASKQDEKEMLTEFFGKESSFIHDKLEAPTPIPEPPHWAIEDVFTESDMTELSEQEKTSFIQSIFNCFGKKQRGKKPKGTQLTSSTESPRRASGREESPKFRSFSLSRRKK